MRDVGGVRMIDDAGTGIGKTGTKPLYTTTEPCTHVGDLKWNIKIYIMNYRLKMYNIMKTGAQDENAREDEGHPDEMEELRIERQQAQIVASMSSISRILPLIEVL